MQRATTKATQRDVKQAMDRAFGNLTDLIQLPVEEQAEYADVICRNIVKDKGTRGLGLDDPRSREFERWNSTSLGNVAYIALYHQQSVATKALQLLREYEDWYFARNNRFVTE